MKICNSGMSNEWRFPINADEIIISPVPNIDASIPPKLPISSVLYACCVQVKYVSLVSGGLLEENGKEDEEHPVIGTKLLEVSTFCK